MNYNVTLSKGAKAGKYYKMTSIDNMDECVGHCCRSKICDVAFMVNKNCYLVKCHNSDSCELKQSDNPKFDTMLSMVSKSNTKSIEGERLHCFYYSWLFSYRFFAEVPKLALNSTKRG